MRKNLWAIVLALVIAVGMTVMITDQSPAAAATRTVAANADTYTRYDAKTSNYGTATRASVSGQASHWRHTLLKFRLPVLPAGETVSGASLRLYATSASTGLGADVYATTNDWTETGVTWNTAPARGIWLAKKGGYAAASTILWDVTKGVRATASNVDVAFRIETNEAATLSFETRETTSGHAPQLVLTTTGTSPSPSPTPTPTPTPSIDGVQAAVANNWGSVVSGDEFSYTGAPNSAKWSVYNSAGHAGKGLRSPTAWNVDGSVARVTGNSAGTTGGMSASFGRRKYGRWEVRMRTSARDPEYHPVLLLWPDSGSWPCDGEVDYAEGTSDTTLMHVYLHHGCDNQQTSVAQAIDTTQWHNYAVDWQPNGITGYIDGAVWFRDTNTAHLPPGSMHQTVQLDWFPDGTTLNPSWMEVNWVRTYNATSPAPARVHQPAPVHQ